MTGHRDNQGVEPASGKDNTTLDAQAWQRWQSGHASAEEIEHWQQQLHQQLPQIPPELLDPSLLPIALLRDPSQWSPEDSGLAPVDLLTSHRDLTHANQLLSSGRLREIALGHRSLFTDLPPVHLQAYRDGLRPVAREDSLSALEHLAGIGRERFQKGRPLGMDLDRYQPPIPDPAPTEPIPSVASMLVVFHPTQKEAEAKSARTSQQEGWGQIRHAALEDPSGWSGAPAPDDETLVSFCHASDQLDPQAALRMAQCAAKHPAAVLLTSDETLRWSDNPGIPAGNRQSRTAITPFRLLCRGCLGGLVTIRCSTLQQLTLPASTSSLHALLLDLALQICRRGDAVAHCPEVLLQRSIRANPTVPDVASPADRQCWSPELSAEILAITQRHSPSFLVPGGQLTPVDSLSACHQLQLRTEPTVLVSVLIPFRDRVDLTQSCVASLRRCAGAVSYELILIDNGSEEAATKAWLDEQAQLDDVCVVRVDEPFNYSRLNNIGRRHARGCHLLLLNNDIEFRSAEVLQALLDPFAYRGTTAVGAKLRYPDGSIQHQGVALVKGERRCVVEPGKHLHSAPVLATLTPLLVQEEFTAATGACLMLRSSDFDRIQGFDEDLAVVFNDVDLCLRLRQSGASVVVTPFVEIVHHESISRGKDREGAALARHQRESGHLRAKHARLFAAGDPLTSQCIHPHSNRYQPRDPVPRSKGPVADAVLMHWRDPNFQPSRQRPIVVLAHFSANNRFRDDLFPLIDEYRRFADVIVVSSASGLRWHPRTLHRLRQRCAAIVIRRNQGYDFGSWKAALNLHRQEIEQAAFLVLTNDSFWGPITPLDDLFQRLHASSADVIGLTDDLMYEPHLSSAFTAYKRKALQCPAFGRFWETLQIWPRKRDLVKHCEVGLPVQLQAAGLRLESLYTHNANGNVLHYDWKHLIEQRGFPFLKVSLLRDNPTRQPVDTWPEVIGQRNPQLAASIQRQLRPKPGLKRMFERLRRRGNASDRRGSRAVIAPTSRR
ncbi:rhamnan synthesis F family protein [Synechococcus sp. MU1617]|uniref:rhamnan synthesis F family protein n=1 Tax=Synechococcus sp. MU1617 TaxID=2508346 RepID=UPI001CF88508|nr:rhamnan synthesis F family protein [Synechococcus sp. MU1617]MCB4389919.1 glycosyltransferase [Synechococcus sp. MU1617]